MADQKLTALTALTTPDVADELYIVDDPAGTPTSKKITIANLFAGIQTGWNPDVDTWVYVSATTFRIEGKDVRSKFPKGTKLKLTQTTDKYFYVVGSAFSTDTTITVMAGSTYTLADEAITSPYYSYASTPQGFPQWFDWTPIYTGVSSQGTTIVAKFLVNGQAVHFLLDTGNQPSNDTGFTATLPITSATTPSKTGGCSTYQTDNSVALTVPVKWEVPASSTTVVFYTNFVVNTWTASNTKRVFCSGFYQI